LRISTEGLRARHRRLIDLLAHDGDLEANDLDPDDSPAAFDFRIKAPGGALGHLVSFRYFERYDRVGMAWQMVEYVYLVSRQNGNGQFEYHWHPLPWSAGRAVLHLHCQPPDGPRGHFRGHVILLEEARVDLLRRYAAGAPVDCGNLFPLSSSR